jgi:glycogen synthase
VPVIGARAGGIPGVITDGQDGLLVPFGNVAALTAAISQLLTEPALTEKMGAAGRQKTISHYTWSQVAEQVLADYQRALRNDS